MDFEAYLHGGLEGFLSATVAAPKSAPTPFKPAQAKIAPVKVASRPGIVTSTPNAPRPSTATPPARGNLTRTPSGAGSSGPSLPVETKAPDAPAYEPKPQDIPVYDPKPQDVPVYDPGPTPQDMNLPTAPSTPSYDETVFAPPVTASGRRGSMLPWILIFVGLAFAYTMTEEKK